MTEAVFLDTNVLIYTMSTGAKADIANDLVLAGGSISVQVMNEFAHVSRRKLKADFTTIHHSLSVFSKLLTVHPLTLEGHRRGLALAERYQLAIFDGQILAAALNAGCDVLYSEDMHDGLVAEGLLTVRNPFRN